MINKNFNNQQSKQKESLASRKQKPTTKPLADLIKQINEPSEITRSKAENPWQPQPPLAA
ncbi:MAG: hypothetical protein HY819_12395 [Acidobacteria bacterium]|nr:hypothetical protein [Acidobacteriota bacterium]